MISAWKRIFYKNLFLASLSWVSFLGLRLRDASQTSFSELSLVKILSCVDGDTCLARTKMGLKFRLRLIGIDAPEISGQLLALEAAAALRARVVGRRLWLDSQGFDRYGRRLGRLFPAEGRGRGKSINEEMIEEGWAIAYRSPRGEAHAWALGAEATAKKNKRGLWRLAPGLFEDPKEFRKRKKRQ
jgi:endonuclease YncB( thermonuclease family)